MVETHQPSPNTESIAKIHAKQLSPFLIPGGVGVAMLFGSIWLKFFGVLFVAYTVWVYRKYKDRIVCEITQDALIIYPLEENKQAITIPWSSIKVWDVQQGVGEEDHILIETTHDEIHRIKLFGPHRVTKYIEKYAPKRNRHVLVRNERNQGNSFLELFKPKGARK